MDDTDRRIMHATQAGLPLVAEPYQALAEQLGISKGEIMQRLSAMQEKGIIRRIAAVPNHYRLGYRFNGMTVWDIPDASIDALGQQVGQLPFVSHCYRRPRHLPEWPYNLFAMVHSKTQTEANVQIMQIADLLGENNRGSAVLYSSRILKKTGFRSSDRLVADQRCDQSSKTHKTSRKSTRLSHYDYSQNGAYFITLCSHNRLCLFGRIENDSMQANDYGNIVIAEWNNSATIRKEIVLGEFVLMPNHFHAIVFINRSGERLLAVPERPFTNIAQIHPSPCLRPKSLGALVAGFKSSVTKKINAYRNSPGQPIWQRNYYERVLRNEDELYKAREYIVNNPMQWALDKYNPVFQGSGK